MIIIVGGKNNGRQMSSVAKVIGGKSAGRQMRRAGKEFLFLWAGKECTTVKRGEEIKIAFFVNL